MTNHPIPEPAWAHGLNVEVTRDYNAGGPIQHDGLRYWHKASDVPTDTYGLHVGIVSTAHTVIAEDPIRAGIEHDEPQIVIGSESGHPGYGMTVPINTAEQLGWALLRAVETIGRRVIVTPDLPRNTAMVADFSDYAAPEIERLRGVLAQIRSTATDGTLHHSERSRQILALVQGAVGSGPADAERDTTRCPQCQGPREDPEPVDAVPGRAILCTDPFHAAATDTECPRCYGTGVTIDHQPCDHPTPIDTGHLSKLAMRQVVEDTGGAIEFTDTADYRDIGNGERVLTGIRRITLVTSDSDLANGVADLVREALADAARRKVIEDAALEAAVVEGIQRAQEHVTGPPVGGFTGIRNEPGITVALADEHTADVKRAGTIDVPTEWLTEPEPEDKQQPFNHRMCGTRHTVEEGCPRTEAQDDSPPVKPGDVVVVLQCPEPSNAARHVDQSGDVFNVNAENGRPTVKLPDAGQCYPLRWRLERIAAWSDA